MKQVSMRPTIGKMIFSVWLTTRAGFIFIRRSFSLVKRRINGGWMSGMRAM